MSQPSLEYLRYSIDHWLGDLFQRQTNNHRMSLVYHSGVGDYPPQCHLQFIGVLAKVTLNVHRVGHETHLRTGVHIGLHNKDIRDLPVLSYDQKLFRVETPEHEHCLHATDGGFERVHVAGRMG